VSDDAVQLVLIDELCLTAGFPLSSAKERGD